MFEFNLKSNFKYQNKYFFEKAESLFNFYKSENDKIYFEEHPNGTGYIKLIKKNYNDLELKIELYCNENHVWKIKTIFDNKIKEFDLHYIDNDYDMIQLQKELIKYAIK